MNLDEYMKQTILWNMEVFRYFYSHSQQIAVQKIAAQGYGRNLYLMKQIADLTFVPGDSEAAEKEVQGFAGMGADGPMSPISAQVQGQKQLTPPEEEKEKRDLAELEKIFSLEYDKKENEFLKNNANNQDITTSGNPDNDSNWFKNIFKHGSEPESENGPQS